MTIVDTLTDSILEWWDARRFWLGFIAGWLSFSITLMIMVTFIKLGVTSL